MSSHKEAIQIVINALIDSENVISNMSEAAVDMVVHGGEEYAESVIIDDEVMKSLKECVKLAPLHNPPNMLA